VQKLLRQNSNGVETQVIRAVRQYGQASHAERVGSMRILIASYFVLPSSGGLWTYVDQLKRGLERLGHEVDLIAQHPDNRYYMQGNDASFEIEKARPLIKQMVINAYNKRNLPLVKRILRLETQRYLLEAAFAYFGIKKYDIIHTQDIISTRAAARVKSHRTPLVATVHGCLALESLMHGVVEERDSLHYDYMAEHEYIGMMSADKVIAPSAWIKNLFVEQFHVPDRQICVVMNGMNIDSFVTRMCEPCESVPHSHGKKVIACNARLDRTKGHIHLFDALFRLKEERSDWVCWLIGDGVLREELEDRCRELQLGEHVLFLGNRNDVPALFSAADLVVLPSVQENCPYAVMEAQVAGRTVIASAVGGIVEMIQHEDTGLLTVPGSSDSLYTNLIRALKEEDLCKELGERSQKWGREKWSLETMKAQTMTVYEQARQDMSRRRRVT
jgi:glycosyltransferase involved in cell wall biosynthesis